MNTVKTIQYHYIAIYCGDEYESMKELILPDSLFTTQYVARHSGRKKTRIISHKWNMNNILQIERNYILQILQIKHE